MSNTSESTRKPTAEQQAIIDAAISGGNLVIQAGAGTGKTSTLEMIAEALAPMKILYLVYNRAAKDEAEVKLAHLPTVTVKTTHGLAFATHGRKYQRRFKVRMNAKVVASTLGATWLNLADDLSLSPARLASITQATLKRFCYSADSDITGSHVPFQNGITGGNHEQLKSIVLPLARRYWEDAKNVNGILPFNMDYYLKMYALSNPHIDAEVVFLDEAQDSNPCVANLVRNQTHAQQIVVGDGCQQMYAWRGAVDALATWPNAEQLYLTQSWRFGEAIAEEANRWLSQLDTPLRLSGNPALDSVVETIEPGTEDAILCRTNGGAMGSVMSLINQGKKVALVGGGEALASLASAALDLMGGRRTSHAELYAFKSWAEVRDYVEGDENAGDLKTMVKLIDDHGPAVIIETTKALVPEGQATVVVSTAHKAKGREWDSVRLGGDFFTPTKGEQMASAEIMIAYVAVTRAKLVLDCSSLVSDVA